MEEKFDYIINSAGGIKDNFIFLCSFDLKTEINEYKGIKVRYSNLLQKETIIYMPSPFWNDYT